MMPKLPSRAALLIPVLGLGLFVPSFNASLTRADTMAVPCELAAVADSGGSAAGTESADDALLLKAILPDDAESALAASAPRPGRRGAMSPEIPVSPGAPRLPGDLGLPKPSLTKLRPPDPALLNAEPIVAARQLQESLTEQQKADLRAVMTKHQDALQRARGRLPELATGPRENRAVTPDGQDGLNPAPADVQGISDQIDQDIRASLTPEQRALLEKARPQRLRAEQPESSEVVAVESAPGC